jgi:tetratricopeptide (TPR) repeat protein
LDRQAAEPGGEAVAVQLGAVCGSQGDALRKLQRPAEAAARYEQAVDHLQSCAAPSAEVQHALTVSLNKLGDLRYMQGDLPAARQQYSAALDIRQAACASEGGGTAMQQLDLAASLVKVADVSGALGDAKTLESLSGEARKLVTDIDEAGAPDKAGAAKLAGLRAYFAAQQEASTV